MNQRTWYGKEVESNGKVCVVVICIACPKQEIVDVNKTEMPLTVELTGYS